MSDLTSIQNLTSSGNRVPHLVVANAHPLWIFIDPSFYSSVQSLGANSAKRHERRKNGHTRILWSQTTP